MDTNPFNMPWDKGIVGLVAQEGRALNLPDAHAHSKFDSAVEKATGYIVKSMLCVPIRHALNDHRTIGVLQTLNKRGAEDAYFSDKDEAELDMLSRLISDSFFRHRWKALESWPSRGDCEAMSMISETMQRPTLEKRNSSIGFSNDVAVENSNVGTGKAEDSFQWVDAPIDAGGIPPSHLRSLSFSALACSPEELAGFVEPIMRHAGCIERCAVRPDRLRNWACAAKRLYRDNPFHNFAHGFSVFQMCYYQLYTSTIYMSFTWRDVFGLLIAALCHDLDHPGFNNGFMMDSQSDLALRYNDAAVLENHHASLACGLLRHDETAISSGLDRAAQQALRRVVIKCILDTDMAHHAGMCKQLRASKSSADDKQLMLSACIHSADLSAQVQPWQIAANWEERISTEFAHQAAEETSMGRTPAPFMNIRLDDFKQRGKLQRDFVDFVLLPLWDPYTQVVPQLRHCYDNLINNRSCYDYVSNTGEYPASLEQVTARDKALAGGKRQNSAKFATALT